MSAYGIGSGYYYFHVSEYCFVRSTRAAFYFVLYRFRVSTRYSLKLLHLAVLHKRVGQSDARYVGVMAVVAHPFEHRRAEPSSPDAVLNGYDAAEVSRNVIEQPCVERLDEAHVVVSHRRRAALRLQTVYRLGGVVSYRTVAEYGKVGALAYEPSGAHLYLLEGALPVGEQSSAARIAYDERPLSGQLRGVHQPLQLALVHGRCYGEVGYGSQRGNVERPVVCWSVLAHESGAVETEHYGQVEYGGVVYDVVVGSLRERAVYVAERYESVLSHSAREGHGVPLGYAHVERPVRHRLHHDVHGASCGHGGRHPHYARIVLGKAQERLPEHVLIARRAPCGHGVEPLSRLGVELPRRVPYGGFLLGRLISLAFGGVEMQQFLDPSCP